MLGSVWLDPVLALIAAAIGWRVLPVVALALAYAAIRAVWNLAAPEVSTAGAGWYLYWGLCEVTVILAAVRIGGPAARPVMLCGMGLFLTHLVGRLEYPTAYTVVYDAYRPIVQTLEGGQLAALLWFGASGQLAIAWVRARSWAKEMPWLKMLAR